jgi:hypothetical protein
MHMFCLNLPDNMPKSEIEMFECPVCLIHRNDPLNEIL